MSIFKIENKFIFLGLFVLFIVFLCLGGEGMFQVIIRNLGILNLLSLPLILQIGLFGPVWIILYLLVGFRNLVDNG